jgi:hypothetical protein
MIALLDGASWLFQASHWATSHAQISSVNSGMEALCAISMPVPLVRSFWAATTLANYQNRNPCTPLPTSVSS